MRTTKLFRIPDFTSNQKQLLTCSLPRSLPLSCTGRDGSKITTVVATPGQGTDRVQEVSYTDTKVIGNGSFGVVFQAKLCDTGELVAIKKVLQDRRFKVRSSLDYIPLSSIYIYIHNHSLSILES